jgi:hypothetical protein
MSGGAALRAIPVPMQEDEDDEKLLNAIRSEALRKKSEMPKQNEGSIENLSKPEPAKPLKSLASFYEEEEDKA